MSQKYKISDLLPLDGILITHEHPDHVDPSFINNLVGATQIPVVANESTAKILDGVSVRVVNDKEQVEIAGFQITARELPHCLLVDGTEGPQNTGYLIDGVFFHPGDGTEISGLSVRSTAVTLAGPDISPKDVVSFVKSVGASTVVPIHYDYFPADTTFFGNIFKASLPAVNYIPLSDGESADI